MTTESFILLTSVCLLISAFISIFLFRGALILTWERKRLRIFSLLLFLYSIYLLSNIMDSYNYYYWVYVSSIVMAAPFFVTFMYKKREQKEIKSSNVVYRDIF